MFRINVSRYLINVARSILTGKIAASEKAAQKLAAHTERLEVDEAIAINQIERHYDALHVKASDAIEANKFEKTAAILLLQKIS